MMNHQITDEFNQEPEDTRPTRPQRIRRKPENTHSKRTWKAREHTNLYISVQASLSIQHSKTFVHTKAIHTTIHSSCDPVLCFSTGQSHFNGMM